MTVLIDSSTPPRANNLTGTNVTSASFNPPVNSLILVCLSANSNTGIGVNGQVTNNGSPLSWQLIDEHSYSVTPIASGYAGMFWALTASALTGLTVTGTMLGASGIKLPTSMKLYVLTEVDLLDPIGSYGRGGSLEENMNTEPFVVEQDDSIVFVVCSEWDAGVPGPISEDTTLDSTNVSGTSSVSVASGYKYADIQGSSTTFNLDARAYSTAAQFNWVGAEIRAENPVIHLSFEETRNVNATSSMLSGY